VVVDLSTARSTSKPLRSRSIWSSSTLDARDWSEANARTPCRNRSVRQHQLRTSVVTSAMWTHLVARVVDDDMVTEGLHAEFVHRRQLAHLKVVLFLQVPQHAGHVQHPTAFRTRQLCHRLWCYAPYHKHQDVAHKRERHPVALPHFAQRRQVLVVAQLGQRSCLGAQLLRKDVLEALVDQVALVLPLNLVRVALSSNMAAQRREKLAR